MRPSIRKANRSQTINTTNSFSIYLEQLDEEKSSVLWRIRQFDYHTFKHFILHLKYNTIYGLWWDVLLVVLSLVACAIYVMETYWASYWALSIYTFIENVITQFFLIDFIFGWLAAHSTRLYFTTLFTWVDLATIAPVYLNYMLSGTDGGPNLSILRFLRILRLIRILKTFRLLGGMSGVKRQTVTLTLALISLIFLAAGVIHIFENELQQNNFDCQYINILTNYEPSCDATMPTYNSTNCDCRSNNCQSYYEPSDKNHEPSSIKCLNLGFFESLFFVIITIYPVGYGSMIKTDASRAAIVLLIIASLIVIPIQINKLALLIAMNSQYRRPFEVVPYENHVLLCGYCNDKEKLSRVLREFFNPDRISTKTPLFHMVIMTPHEPNDDVVDLMNSPLFESRLSYIIGSALDEKDLLKARADVAKAIFFISDSQADYDSSTCEDAATVLRTLSIINYNPDLECFVEVLNEHDKRTLEDCHADVVLCLDDYKFTLQARNSICMGLNTLCENLFNSFSSDGDDVRAKDHWMTEYSHGLGMEMYYFHIDPAFFSMLNYNWAILVECIYLEFGIMLMGVSRTSDHSVHMNPRNYEHKFPSLRAYYTEYTVGVVMAPDYEDVLVMQYALTDIKCVDLMLTKLNDAELYFTTRNTSALKSSGKLHVSKTLVSIQHFSSRSSGLYEDSLVNEVAQAKALSNLLRSQKYFDSKFSLKKCYQKANLRKTGANKLLRKSMSIHSSQGIDSDSSSGNDMDNFLGYIDEDDSSDDYCAGREGGGGDWNEVDELEDSYSSAPSPSNMNSPKDSASYSFSTHFMLEPDQNHWSTEEDAKVQESEQNSKVVQKTLTPHSPTNSDADTNVGTSITETTPFAPLPLVSRPSRKAFIALTPTKGLRGEELAPAGKSEIVETDGGRSTTDVRAISVEGPVDEISPIRPPKNVKKGDGGIKSDSQRKSLAKFGKAAKKVTKMLKDDVWGDAVHLAKSVNLHGEKDDAFQQSSLYTSFLDFPTITPLQRQIMQSKRKKKYDPRSPTKRRVSKVTQPLLEIDTDLEEEAKPVLSKGLSQNFATTYRGFFKQQSLQREASSRTLQQRSRRKSIESSDDEVPISKQSKEKNLKKQQSSRVLLKLRSNVGVGEDEAYERNTLDKRKPNLNVITAPDRSSRFQTKGAYSSLGGGLEKSSTSETDKDRKAQRLRSFHKGRSNVTSSDSIQRPSYNGPALDIGEIMGVTSPSVKRTLSKSKSKDICVHNTLQYKHSILRADSFEEKKVSTVAGGVSQVELEEEKASRVHGQEKLPSVEIKNASALKDHVIVLGCLDFLIKFVKALRKSNLSTHENYHSILIVSEEEPVDWEYIKGHYKDVFFLKRATKTDNDLLYMNLRGASSITIFGSRSRETLDEATNIDSKVLFLYLAIERKIPAHINITVEIFRPSSVGVVNSAINHHHVAMGGRMGAQATGISRKGTSVSGQGMKIGGNDHKSFYAGIFFNENEDDDEEDFSGEEFDNFEDAQVNLNHKRAFAYRHEKIVPISRAVAPRPQGRASPMAVAGRKVQVAPTSPLTRNKKRLSISGMDLPDTPLEPVKKQTNKAMNFWGSRDTHHVMPVFAAGRAFVPTAFDAIFIQVCEKLITGDEAQLAMQIKVPTSFVGRRFADLFRAVNVRGLLLLGLYRSPHACNEAQLPYVFTNPPADTLLRAGDNMYVFGHPELVKDARKSISQPLQYKRDGKRVSMSADSDPL